ncbi:O-linked N-acetylglucosamine transferase family protein [Vagococcus sp. WN89Y]|uniref:O-linked N-acetylglucosamine transferase family protein n=1 Tax=Vagococcus sp. WN89Y TaxID=3457258 RepID=UPI003FCDB677
MSTFYPDYRITPDAMHAAAAINHLASVTPSQARVLELGCAGAQRLVMQAAACPHSVAIGIDIDEAAIAQGQQLVSSLGSNNVELFAVGLGDLLAVDPGEFDYIIIHGAFSFLASAEREALLGWCQTHLSANGVIGLRWSVLPGAMAHSTLRDALLFHLQRVEEGGDLLSAARGMLSFLAVTLEEGAFKNAVLAAEKLDDTTLALTYLSQGDSARTLATFADEGAKAGLGYVGDLLPQYELVGFYPEHIRQMIGAVSAGADRVMAQQYLDYATQRVQRFSLLAHAEALTTPVAPDLRNLEQLHWAGNFTRMLNSKGQTVKMFVNGAGETIYTPNACSIQILDLLSSAWPQSLSFEQLVFNCRQPEKSEDVRKAVWESLHALFMNCTNGLYWSASPGCYNQAQNDTLGTIVPLPVQRPEDELALVNLWGESVGLTACEWDYLQGGMRATDDDGWANYLSLKTKGILIGSPLAWKKQLQLFLRAGRVETLKSQLSTLLLLSVSESRGGLLHSEIHEPVLSDARQDDDAIYAEVNRLIRAGLSQEARQYAQSLLLASPENMHILRCHSRACILTGAWEDALPSLCRLMGYYFTSLDIYYDLAVALQKNREHFHARKIVHALLRLDDKNVDFWYTLATIHHAYGDMALAEKCCRETLRFPQVTARHMGMTGIILSDNQKLAEARYFLEKSVELSNYDFDYFTSLLFVMTHDFSVTPQELREKHFEYGRRVDEWAKRCNVHLPLNNLKDPERKLRVGFVSGDLRKHPVTNFLLPFWDGMDREKFELVAYSTTFLNNDSVAHHLRETALMWRQVDALSNVELAQLINEDGIDILFDLSGHTTYNRLPAFALRPAPVQISWIGYPGTTGLVQMDYRLLYTTLAKSVGLQEQLTERIMYIETRKLFEPHPQSPQINTLPALSNGYVTFGSFNRPKKINDNVLQIWAKVMVASPNAKLLLGFMTDEGLVASVKKRLLGLGVREDQLIFRGLVEIDEYLAYHHEIDLLLDAFPYTGGTTTNHGAWMGVPTLTIAGKTVAGQQGVDIMRAYRLDEFVATDEEDYLRKALYWRDHPQELNAIRLGMRERIPTENEAGYNIAGTFETALREAWALYCRGEAPKSLLVEEKTVSFL